MCVSCWRPTLFGLAAAYMVFLGQCPCQALAADWKDRLLSEAPPKWAALERYYAKMEASVRVIYTSKPKLGLDFPDSAYGDVRRNGDWIVSTSHQVGKTSDGKRMDSHTAAGVNSRYAFQLAKTSPDAKSFILSKFQPATDEYRRSHQGQATAFRCVYLVNSWDCIAISEFVKSPDIKITDVRGVQRGEREMAQLSYERQRKSLDGRQGTERGTVILDPEHCWCVQECNADLPDFMPVCKTDNILEYSGDVDGFPLLYRWQESITYRDGKGKLVTTYEYDKVVHRDIPESEFTLSAFGLPEVQVPGEQKPRTLWRWLIGIGIALSVLAVLLRAYAKRRGRMPQST